MAFFDAHVKAATASSFIPAVFTILNPRGQAFYKQDKSSGKLMGERNLLGERSQKRWTVFKCTLGKVIGWMTEGDTLVLGETPTYADVTMFAGIISLRIVLSEDSPE
ncbi:uncharacterized protein EV420DRAFT_513919 [Desarmillaria tabescens]|uniref:Glutathione S-transferase UstS-like C-terminal domain-containing protein n=1 Tax=Armillaria tabescens TaxID=1929756 RepID=A0AA39N4K4_ARMTA|nr:uncharacterized protein EV420DRAFT_513919 [Desarmillaria tabescens]KAK0457233.1 hypothetical protein EV420DRAFT_513919 [Desarmillaria tabescens]